MKRWGLAAMVFLVMAAGLLAYRHGRASQPFVGTNAEAEAPGIEPKPPRHITAAAPSYAAPLPVVSPRRVLPASDYEKQAASTCARLSAGREIMHENIDAVAARMNLTPEQVAALHKMTDVAVDKQVELYGNVHSGADMGRAVKQVQGVIMARAKAEYRVLKNETEHARYQQLRSAASQGILDQVNDDGLPGKPGERHVPSSGDLTL